MSTIDIYMLQLRTNQLNPLVGSSYLSLPKFIESKKAIINVKNKDNKCFMYSILSTFEIKLDKIEFNKIFFKILEKKVV